MTDFDGVDASHRIAGHLVRRARPDDAGPYCRLDAELVTATYAELMPPEFAVRQFEDVAAGTVRLRHEFGQALADESAGREPARRTWVALDGDRMVGLAVCSRSPQPWEESLGAQRVPGVDRQLEHLYLHPSTWGTGLADGMLALALPDDEPAYLWIVEGNARAWRFYERHGFTGDGQEYQCGPLWYHRLLYRMVRNLPT